MASKIKSTIMHMNRVAGYNNKAYTVGKILTFGGLVIATIGSGLLVKTVGKFDVDECELAHEFVDSIY